MKNSGGFIIKILWLILTLTPVPFLFHYYEITQYNKGEEASFLLVGSLLVLFIVVIGGLSRNIKLLHVILVNLVTIIVSVVLAVGVITAPNPSWFNPFRMELVIVLTGVAIFIGQIVVRGIGEFIGKIK